MRFPIARFTGLAVAILLGAFLAAGAKTAWLNYWLLKDADRGIALVTKNSWSGHNGVEYRYVVDGVEYDGTSQRNRHDPRYSHAQPGETSVVYFSASHPWLSSLDRPEAIVVAVPVLLIALVLEIFAIATVVNPRGRWAFRSGGRGR